MDDADVRLAGLAAEASACRLCRESNGNPLPHEPRPVFVASRAARILIASQAPGRKAHESGRPFSDASGDRLRDWLGVTAAQFYDPTVFAIVPMGLCFPGTGPSGDLPPRPQCAAHWRRALLAQLPALELSLVIGQYALAYHLPPPRPVTAAVRAWRDGWPKLLPLPHPSPRNNRWLRDNPWFAQELLPVLRQRIAGLLGSPG